MVSCQKGPTRHAYAWQIGPCFQDTLDMWQLPRLAVAAYPSVCGVTNTHTWGSTAGPPGLCVIKQKCNKRLISYILIFYRIIVSLRINMMILVYWFCISKCPGMSFLFINFISVIASNSTFRLNFVGHSCSIGLICDIHSVTNITSRCTCRRTTLSRTRPQWNS